MKIMVCYTNTPASKHAVHEAQKHARIWNAHIDVVQVVHRDMPIRRSRLKEMEAAFEQEIEALFGENDPAYNAQLQVDDIDIGEKIVKIAKRKKADLLFMGLKRQSKVGKLLFGSTAQHVLLNAPCPVVTVNPV
jgi:nucleotide-binding universal stress UspA family protein